MDAKIPIGLAPPSPAYISVGVLHTMDRYERKQMILKRADGTPAGFLRLERVGNRCSVEVRVDGPGTDLHAVLLGDGNPFPLGKISRGRTIHAPKAEDMNSYSQAAVLSGERLLYVGGDTADFKKVRSTLAKPPGRRSAKAVHVDTVDTWDGQAQPPAQQDVPDDPMRQTANDPMSPDDPIDVPTIEAATPAAYIPPPADGWVFTPYKRDVWDCYSGQLMQNGQITARMHAVSGSYALEPPPGLTGFVWDSGYWVQAVILED